MGENRTIPQTVVISPLNWGLGHATRCVPVIDFLIKYGAEVVLAGNGASLNYLEKQFPQLKSIQIPGVDIRYSKGNNQAFTIGKQLPAFMKAIREEHKTINRLVNDLKPDLIISDNRYGVHHKSVRSVIITHQLKPKFPLFRKMGEAVITRHLKPFDEIWIPDVEGSKLSGALSSHAPEERIKYMGLLSAFSCFTDEGSDTSAKYDCTVLLSGPEPQRTLFHEKALAFFSTQQGKYAVVGNSSKISTDANVEELGVLHPKQLYQVLSNSSWIIARSGYSSVMDLAYLGKPVVFVPTPGQAEQEYLAEHLHQAYNVAWVNQKNLSGITESDFKKLNLRETAFNQYKKSLTVNSSQALKSSE